MSVRNTPYEDSIDLLQKCDVAMDELEAKCCAPGRSPQMQELRQTLQRASSHLVVSHESPRAAEVTVEVLAQAGEQIGRLQVTCCAPSRMPLYDDLLHSLMQMQRAVKRHAKLAH